MSRILIMAGGTGGHIFPGLAVAAQMRAAGWEVVWMGARGAMEERLVPPQGYRTAGIRARAARGKGLVQKLLLPANLLFSFWESARHILREKPAVVLGLGGYVAFPGGMMASLLGRPLALHEQNAIAGLANRVLAGVCDQAMTGFPGALKNAAVRAFCTATSWPKRGASWFWNRPRIAPSTSTTAIETRAKSPSGCRIAARVLAAWRAALASMR